MFGAPNDDFLEMLMSGKGQEYLDREIQKMRKEIGEQEFQQFADQYFKNEGTQNIYQTSSNNQQKQLNTIKQQLPKKQDDTYLTAIADQTQKISNNQKSNHQQQIANQQNTQTQANQQIQQVTCEQDQQFKQISRQSVQGTNKVIIKYNNGDQYHGQMDGLQKSGWGTYFFANGQKYDGCFVQDQIHGYGHYHFAGGAQYEGDWSSGMKHGIGILKLSNKDIYQGMFSNDEFHGTGKYKSNNGDIYDGQWKKGKRHGKGKFEGSDGRLMIGLWKQGEFTVD